MPEAFLGMWTPSAGPRCVPEDLPPAGGAAARAVTGACRASALDCWAMARAVRPWTPSWNGQSKLIHTKKERATFFKSQQ